MNGLEKTFKRVFWVIVLFLGHFKAVFECDFVLLSTHNQSIVGVEIDRLAFSLFVVVCFGSL